MNLTLLIYSVLSLLISEITATALTYKLGSSEKACFYAVTKKEAEKIAFYFAVRLPKLPAAFTFLNTNEIQTGSIRRLL